MSYDLHGDTCGTLLAAADLSALQHRFVKVDNTGKVAQCTTPGERTDGVLTNTPIAGQPAAFQHSNIQKVVAGAAVTAGASVMSDSVGRAITATGGSHQAGVALAAAGAAGELIPVLLNSVAGATPS